MFSGLPDTAVTNIDDFEKVPKTGDFSSAITAFKNGWDNNFTGNIQHSIEKFGFKYINPGPFSMTPEQWKESSFYRSGINPNTLTNADGRIPVNVANFEANLADIKNTRSAMLENSKPGFINGTMRTLGNFTGQAIGPVSLASGELGEFFAGGKLANYLSDISGSKLVGNYAKSMVGGAFYSAPSSIQDLADGKPKEAFDNIALGTSIGLIGKYIGDQFERIWPSIRQQVNNSANDIHDLVTNHILSNKNPVTNSVVKEAAANVINTIKKKYPDKFTFNDAIQPKSLPFNDIVSDIKNIPISTSDININTFNNPTIIKELPDILYLRKGIVNNFKSPEEISDNDLSSLQDLKNDNEINLLDNASEDAIKNHINAESDFTDLDNTDDEQSKSQRLNSAQYRLSQIAKRYVQLGKEIPPIVNEKLGANSVNSEISNEFLDSLNIDNPEYPTTAEWLNDSDRLLSSENDIGSSAILDNDFDREVDAGHTYDNDLDIDKEFEQLRSNENAPEVEKAIEDHDEEFSIHHKILNNLDRIKNCLLGA